MSNGSQHLSSILLKPNNPGVRTGSAFVILMVSVLVLFRVQQQADHPSWAKKGVQNQSKKHPLAGCTKKPSLQKRFIHHRKKEKRSRKNYRQSLYSSSVNYSGLVELHLRRRSWSVHPKFSWESIIRRWQKSNWHQQKFSLINQETVRQTSLIQGSDVAALAGRHRSVGRRFCQWQTNLIS